MADVALTVIGLGHDVNGTYQRVDVQPGEQLPSWVSAKEKQALKDAGAYGAPEKVDASVVDEKDARIAELEAQLAAASAAKAPEAPEAPEGSKDK